MGSSTILLAHDELGNICKMKFTCTADSTKTATKYEFTTKVLPKFDGKLKALVTNPGSPAPSANYDITLVDQHGLDRIQGVGANRHTTTTEFANIVISGGIDHPVVAQSDTLTLTIANSTNASAVTVVELYYGRGS